LPFKRGIGFYAALNTCEDIIIFKKCGELGSFLAR